MSICQLFSMAQPHMDGQEESGTLPMMCSILLTGKRLFLHLMLKILVLMFVQWFAWMKDFQSISKSNPGEY